MELSETMTRSYQFNEMNIVIVIQDLCRLRSGKSVTQTQMASNSTLLTDNSIRGLQENSQRSI